jgi:hypothetical protein
MAKSMAEKQFDATLKAAGQYADEEIWIYTTSVDVWTRVLNKSFEIEDEFFMDLFKKKGFEVVVDCPGNFVVKKLSLLK